MDPASYLLSNAALLAFAWMTFRVFVRRDYRQRGRLTPLSVFLEYAVFFGWGWLTYLDWLSAGSRTQAGPILRLASWILIVVGLAITLIAMARLGVRRMHGLDSRELEATGLYGLTRNPQIVGSSLAVAGCALYWPSWHSLGWLVLYLVICHMMVLTEEEHLQRALGERYARYLGSVPRYLPLRHRR